MGGIRNKLGNISLAFMIKEIHKYLMMSGYNNVFITIVLYHHTVLSYIPFFVTWVLIFTVALRDRRVNVNTIPSFDGEGREEGKLRCVEV